MSTFSERLKLAMAGPPRIKQVEVAAACGIKPPSVSDWLSGRSVNIEGKNLLSAAKVLNVRPEWLSKGIGPMRPFTQHISPPSIESKRTKTANQVPLITSKQAAKWRGQDDSFKGDWRPAPSGCSNLSYAMQVANCSMEPKFREGEDVIIDPEVTALPGKFVAVKSQGSPEIILRQLIVEGNNLFLKAANPFWPEPIIRMTSNWILCGTVICKIEFL
jgi:SOS-response transcriptional repressor LexA